MVAFDRAPPVSATLTGNTWHAVNTVLYRRSNELLNHPICTYGLHISCVAGQNTISAGVWGERQSRIHTVCEAALRRSPSAR